MKDLLKAIILVFSLISIILLYVIAYAGPTATFIFLILAIFNKISYTPSIICCVISTCAAAVLAFIDKD